MSARRLFPLVIALALVLGACAADVEVATGTDGSADGGESSDAPGVDGAEGGEDTSGDAGSDDGDGSADGADEADDGADEDGDGSADEDGDGAEGGEDTSGDAGSDDGDGSADGGEASGEATAAAAEVAAQLADGPVELPASEVACVAAAIEGDTELIGAATGGTSIDSLAPDVQDRLIDALDACVDGATVAELVANGFSMGSADAGVALSAEQQACLTDAFAGDEAKRVLLEAAVRDGGTGDVALPPAQAQLIAGLLAGCLDGSFLGPALLEGALSSMAGSGVDPSAIDEGCIAGVLGGDLLERFFTAALQGLEFEDMPLEVQTQFIGRFLECVDLGAVFQASFAEQGVTLSDTSAQCIADAMVDAGIFDALIAGEEPTDAAVGALLIGCLTPDELAQLGG